MPSLERLTQNARVVAHVLYLASVGTLLAPLSRRWRSRLTRAWVASTHPFMERETDLGDFLERSLDRVIVGPVASAYANVSELELLALCSLVSQVRARAIFEIGTYDGRTTLAMARNLDSGGHVYTLNLPPDWEDAHPGLASEDTALAKRVKSGERFLGTPEAASITQLWGDSKTFDYAPYRGRMDLIFIDGAHSAGYVEADTLTALSLVRPEGGLIVWHDATRYGVVDFLRRYVRDTGAPLRVIRDTSIGIIAHADGRPVDARQWLREHRHTGGEITPARERPRRGAGAART